MDVLKRITETKRTRLAESKRQISLDQLRGRAVEVRSRMQPGRFVAALAAGARVNIIAEIKRASPSKGLIRGDVNPAELARLYAVGGAAAISVLTEEDHFLGSLDDLRAVREATSLPLLRKDFIFDEYQIYESAAAGADAILLIVAALDDESVVRFLGTAENELGLNALVEVHTSEEMKRAAECGATLIGVNNRDLRTFEVSIETSVELARLAPSGAVRISESGLESAHDLRRLRALGYQGFLIGESLMRADKPDEMLRAIISQTLELGELQSKD
jgi:indole-3-glycerol phosphate synthase